MTKLIFIATKPRSSDRGLSKFGRSPTARRYPDRKVVGSFIIIIILNLFANAGLLWLSHSHSSDGEKIRDLESQNLSLQAANQELELNISLLTSMGSLKSKSLSLGFVPLTLESISPLTLASSHNVQ